MTCNARLLPAFQALEQLEQEVRNSTPLGMLETSKLARLSADLTVIATTYRERTFYIIADKEGQQT